MTAPRDLPTARRELQWDERSLLSDHAGVSWQLAVSLALGLTVVGLFVDLERLGQLGIIFQGCYFIGCVLAVSMVRRKGLFGPMVQPPLILAAAVPGVVLVTGSLPPDAGVAATILTIATPLVNGFPTMAITTGLTVAVGLYRIRTQRPPLLAPRDDPPPDQGRPDQGRPGQARQDQARPVPARQGPVRQGPARPATVEQPSTRSAPRRPSRPTSVGRPTPALDDEDTGPIPRLPRHP